MPILLVAAAIYLFPFFLKGHIPIPSDIITGLYYPWLNQGLHPVKNPLMSDIVSIIYQWRLLAIDSIKHFEFPWWNPHYFFGMPLFANFQNSIFNLTNLPFFVGLHNAQAWGMMIYLSLVFSAVSAYLFLRVLKLQPISATVGAITYSMSLFSAVWLEYGIHNYVAAFLPLSLYSIEKYIQTKNKKNLAILSMILAGQLFGGYPQYSIFTFIFVFLYSLVLHRSIVFKIIPFYFFAALLALPILIPGFELTNLSIHSRDVTAQNSDGGFFPLVNIATLISPNFWGNPTTRDYFGRGFYDNNAFYPGLLGLFSFFYFLKNLKSQKSRELTFLFTIPIVLLIASKNPFSVFLKENFGLVFGKGGLSTRIFILSNLAFAFLAAKFVDTSPKPSHKTPTIILFVWLLILVSVAFLVKFNYYQIAAKNTLYTLAFLIAIVIASKSKYYRTALLLVLFGELSYLGWKYLPFSAPDNLFPTTPIIEFLQKNSQHYRIATFDTIPENMWVPFGLSTPDGYDTLVPVANYQQLSLIQSGTTSDTFYRARKLTNFSSPLINSASIKYVLKLTNDPKTLPTEFDPNHYRLAFIEGKVVAVENLNVLPRARLTSDCSGSVTFLEDKANSVKLLTNSSCPESLVLADSYYPGWHAKIDNQPTSVTPTEQNYRSVSIPPGKHLISFYYLPAYFYPSLGISIFTALMLIIFILRDKKV